MTQYAIGGVTECYFVDKFGNKIGGKGQELNLKEEVNLEERLNKFLEENNIFIDEHGNFEVYVVVDADDKDHEIGSIICGKETEIYTEKRAYEDLKEDNERVFNQEYFMFYPFKSKSQNNIKKQTIRENLLRIEDQIFKILVNKENVLNVGKADSGVMKVNKYKVIESIELNPVLKFKIESMNNYKGTMSIKLYNSITQKSKIISLVDIYVNSVDDIKIEINNYLEQNEKEVALINSLAENGVEL